jgi:hypothetical protein
MFSEDLYWHEQVNISSEDLYWSEQLNMSSEDLYWPEQLNMFSEDLYLSEQLTMSSSSSSRQENILYWVLTLRACPFCTVKSKSYIYS